MELCRVIQQSGINPTIPRVDSELPGLNTRLTESQRRQLRDHICAVGIDGNPALLKILAEIDDDFELLMVFIAASSFDDRTPRQTTEFLEASGISATVIAQALEAVLDSLQAGFVHGRN